MSKNARQRAHAERLQAGVIDDLERGLAYEVAGEPTLSAAIPFVHYRTLHTI